MSGMIAKTFSSEGALGKAIPGFQARQPQIDMAEAVSSAIKDQTQLVVEAGTGTGKTFAYLVPALLSGKKSSSVPGRRTCKSNCITVTCL